MLTMAYHRGLPAPNPVMLTVFGPEASVLRHTGTRRKGNDSRGKDTAYRRPAFPRRIRPSFKTDPTALWRQTGRGLYAVSSKLQPFELHLRLAFTGHFLLPSGASVRLTIVVICTAACSLLCSSRFRRYAFPTGRGDERRRWRIQRIESVPNHRVQQVINVVGRQ